MATKDNSVPLSSNKREELTCTSCLKILIFPRILPCSHTFCKECLDHIIDQHPYASFPCPVCSKLIEVPIEGTSCGEFNFYVDEEELDRDKNATTCSVHLQKELEMFCLECNRLLCEDCKLTAHLHHRTQILQDARRDAEQQLSGDKARIRQTKDNVQKLLQKQTTSIYDFKNKKAAIKDKYRDRHATLVAEADNILKKALKSFKVAYSATKTKMSEDHQIILNSVKKLNDLEQKMDRALQNGDSCTINDTTTDVRTGCEIIESMDTREVSPLQGISWIVHGPTVSEEDTLFENMQKFIRQRQQMTYVYTGAEVRVSEEVCCGEDDDSTVFSVCAGDNEVHVLIESSYKQLFHKHLTYQAKWISKTLCGRSGSYKYTLSGLFIMIPFSKTSIKCTLVKFGDPERHYRLETSSDSPAGYVGFDKVVCERPVRTATQFLFSIDCGPHRAVDTNSAADLFAVVEEPRTPSQASSRTVRLFRRDQSAAIATYQSPLTPCQPADVCFFRMAGQESACRPHHSADIALLTIRKDLLTSMDNANTCILTLGDLSTAFDTTDNTTVLYSILCARAC